MKRLFGFGVLLLALAATRPMWAELSTLSAADVRAAIAYGKQFKTVKEFRETALKANRLQIASAWARDGISKYVTFYRDKDVFAAIAATANEQLRELSAAQISNVSITGLLFANVELHARGVVPVRKLNRRYTDGRARLVLQIDGKYVQPVRDGFYPSPQKRQCLGGLYLWSVFGNYNALFGIGTPITYSYECGEIGPGKISLEFAYQLDDDQMTKKAVVVLVDGDGHQHKTQTDLGALK